MASDPKTGTEQPKSAPEKPDRANDNDSSREQSKPDSGNRTGDPAKSPDKTR